MMLLTAANRKALPALHSTDAKDPREIRVPVKFFTPDANWTYFAWEASIEDGDTIFFGLVCGLEKELGYFALSELSAAKGLLGLPIERDRYWDASKTVYDVLKAEGMERLAEALVAGR